MKLTMEFVGLNEIIDALEEMAGDKEVDKLKRDVFRQCATVTEAAMRSLMPRSGNNRKSGRIGYRPPGHAQDNIPVTVSKNGAKVGWIIKGQDRPFFYMKFVEWGTSKQPPQDFVYKPMEQLYGTYQGITEKELQEFARKKLGG